MQIWIALHLRTWGWGTKKQSWPFNSAANGADGSDGTNADDDATELYDGLPDDDDAGDDADAAGIWLRADGAEYDDATGGGYDTGPASGTAEIN